MAATLTALSARIALQLLVSANALLIVALFPVPCLLIVSGQRGTTRVEVIAAGQPLAGVREGKTTSPEPWSELLQWDSHTACPQRCCPWSGLALRGRWRSLRFDNNK